MTVFPLKERNGEPKEIATLFVPVRLPLLYLYNMLSGIIRSMGDSRTPLYFLTLSSFLNIGLDLLCEQKAQKQRYRKSQDQLHG